MGQIKKSGGWESNYGGRDFKSGGGKVNFLGTSKGKGTTPIGPAPQEGKKGQVAILGAGGSKGIPKSNGAKAGPGPKLSGGGIAD